MAYLQKISEANNEFLAQIYEAIMAVAPNEEEKEEPRAMIGFNTKPKKDDA